MTTPPPTTDPIPRGIRIGAAFSWRFLVIVAALAVVAATVVHLAEIIIPFLIGLMLSALLVPLSNGLQRRGWPKWVAILGTWLVALSTLGALGLLVAMQIRLDLPRLETQVEHTIASAKQLFNSHPFGLTPDQLTDYVSDGAAYLREHASTFGEGFAHAGTGVIHAAEGLFIVIFTTLFALIDGRNIWQWVTRLFPRAARDRITAAGDAGWTTLTAFIRIQVVVAATDGIGVGIGAAILGVPLAVPIAVIVFLGAFVPVIGAIIGGIVAVGIALVFHGWVTALLMLGVVIVVQQLESHVFHPLLTGTAVKVHPLGIVLGVTAGSAIAGIVGALFAVPLIATANAMIHAANNYGKQPADEVTAESAAATPDPVQESSLSEPIVDEAPAAA
ncbi:AI-2E family transporter [Curtobacterium sp. MCSS17_016]|uniref:AI-2E family transporter n=1 Tax=Curtobacterium sp. MCSS17_016 TaxID=2175644 RepID=UPI000DA90E50|nr:AI-2E family transporter [Curtobacterium sp. MCSS17_016]WIE81141.1 AI-2E family transporter [Curtobacterium sp. MCSS17_016]